MTTSFKTHPVALKDLMRECHEGKLQLPDFQRGWVWDQDRIIDLLASISEGFPVGALMTLDASGEVAFAVRPVEGAPPASKPLGGLPPRWPAADDVAVSVDFDEISSLTQTAKKRPARLHFYFDIKVGFEFQRRPARCDRRRP